MEIQNLEIDTIFQETCATCGPAAARMVLGSGAPGEAVLFQEILAFMGKRRDPCFVTSPEALANVLGSVTKTSFRVERRKTVDEVNRLIVNVLFDHRVPVPVLVKGCQHWIIASGFLYSEVSAKIQVSTFIVNDPYNTCLDCDHNGVTAPQCEKESFSGDSGEGVPAAEWRESYLTGCKCKPIKDELICVVPADATDGPREVGDSMAPGPFLGPPVEVANLGDYLAEAIGRYELRLIEAFNIALAGAGVRRARKVLSGERAYFLTEVGRSEGVTALFLFDQSTGSLISARPLTRPVANFLPESIEEMRHNLRAWREKNHIEVPLEEELTEETPLRWQFYNEFRSPYFPYVEVGEGVTRVVLGINGVVYGRPLREARA